MKTNQHIRDFLQYYADLQIAPQYAVMIRGAWGSGKTHLINEFRKDAPCTPLYVSLNGISSIKEIEQEFFRQLHPVLSNAKVRLAAKLIQGAIKTTINVDLNDDKKTDGTAQVGLPDLDLSKYASGPDGIFIVFDDLERCQISIKSILGYINYFVEHNKCKVVILADESRILGLNNETTTEGEEYRLMREKVIGKTFEVELDFDAAVNSYIPLVANSHARNTVELNLELIKKILEASEYRNLRHVRQALLDFSRMVDNIQVTIYKPEMLTSLLGTLLMYSLEIRSAFIQPEAIQNLINEDLMWAIENDQTKSRYSKLTQKYGHLGILENFIPASGWQEFFVRGAIAPTSLNEYVRTSKYYSMNQDRPLWLRLWDMYSSDDKVLKEAIDEADRKLSNREFTSLAELLNIAGSLLDLSKHGIYSSSKAAITKISQENIDNLALRGIISLERNVLDLDDDLSFGHRHHAREDDEYLTIKRYAITIHAQFEATALPKMAEDLIDLLPEKIEDFGKKLNSEEEDEENYIRKPILAYADVDLFINKLRITEAVALSKLNRILLSRYRIITEEILMESDWLKQLEPKVEKLVNERANTMAAFWLKYFHKNLFEIIDRYDKFSNIV